MIFFRTKICIFFQEKSLKITKFVLFFFFWPQIYTFFISISKFCIDNRQLLMIFYKSFWNYSVNQSCHCNIDFLWLKRLDFVKKMIFTVHSWISKTHCKESQIPHSPTSNYRTVINKLSWKSQKIKHKIPKNTVNNTWAS